MSVRPLHDRLIAKRIKEEERVMGLVIPDTAKEKPQQAKVVAVGNGKRLPSGEIAPMDVRVGDRIIFGKFAGNEVVVDGDEYVVLREDEVFAIVEGVSADMKAA